MLWHVLRHQLSVLQRQLGPGRVRFTTADRALLAALLHQLPRKMLSRLRSVACFTSTSMQHELHG
jgi:putative transposase